MNYICLDCVHKPGDVEITDGKDEKQTKKAGFISKLMIKDDQSKPDALLNSLFFPTIVCKKYHSKLMEF